MIGGDDDKFATGQKAMGAASASMGSAANSAANKAAQKQGGLIVNSGTNFTGPVAGANEQDIQSQVFGKGYTDLARGLARALGQDKWANRDNLQNQTMQENAFLNQVMKTGQTNIVTGGFSTNGMNIAQNALALGSKGAGNAAANEDNPLGLTGDKAVAFNNRLSSNVSPYVSRAQALADASADNLVQRSLAHLPKWSTQADKAYLESSQWDEKLKNEPLEGRYPKMFVQRNIDPVNGKIGGWNNSFTREKPTYSDVPPNQTGNLNYQSPYSKELWVDSIDPRTGHFDAQQLLNPYSPEPLASRDIRDELRTESDSSFGGKNDPYRPNIHERDWGGLDQKPIDLGKGKPGLQKTPDMDPWLQREIDRENAIRRLMGFDWDQHQIDDPMKPLRDLDGPAMMKGGKAARGADNFPALRFRHGENQMAAGGEGGGDVPAIPSADPNGGRFGRDFGDVLGAIGNFVNGNSPLVKPQDIQGTTLQRGKWQPNNIAVPKKSVGDEFIRSVFETYMGGLAPGPASSDVMNTVGRWLGGQRVNPNVDPRIEADLVRATIDKANSLQKAENSLGVLPRQVGDMGDKYLGAAMASKTQAQAHNPQNQEWRPKEAIKSGRMIQVFATPASAFTPAPRTSPVNSTAQNFFLSALNAYQQAMKATGVKSGAKQVRVNNKGRILNDEEKLSSVSGPIQF